MDEMGISDLAQVRWFKLYQTDRAKRWRCGLKSFLSLYFLVQLLTSVYYGIDYEGPVPQIQTDNNVEIPDVILESPQGETYQNILCNCNLEKKGGGRGEVWG